MANARAIVKRRKAVTNIKKITKTMQLIATAKFQQCFKRAAATQPYTAKLSEMVNRLSARVEHVKHALLEVNQATGRSILLVITSNRGLCGSYNANVVRIAEDHLRKSPAEIAVDLDVVGKKGASYFRFLKRRLRHTHTQFDDKVRFEQVQPLADEFMHSYSRGEIDSVHVAYMRFISASRQQACVEQLLPLRGVGQAETAGTDAGRQYDFSPDPERLLAELLPESVRVRLFQCFTDSVVSEQVSRMVAMKAATDAAGDMIKILTRTYNRARQTQITMELLDIMGGAEALAH